MTTDKETLVRRLRIEQAATHYLVSGAEEVNPHASFGPKVVCWVSFSSDDDHGDDDNDDDNDDDDDDDDDDNDDGNDDDDDDDDNDDDDDGFNIRKLLLS